MKSLKLMERGYRIFGGALSNGCLRRRISIAKFISSTILRRAAHNTSIAYSPSQSKLQSLLSAEIQYQSDYAPPHQPVTEYDKFIVEDRPGEQLVTMKGKSSMDENIKIEATMFDGYIVDQKAEGHLHISMSVDIWKGEGANNNSTNANAMKFICSAWPYTLEIQKAFMCRHDGDDASSPARLYTGPQFKNLNTELQIGFYEFLNTRGVNDGLSMFLHKYMMNKDRIELIQWLGKLNCFLKN